MITVSAINDLTSKNKVGISIEVVFWKHDIGKVIGINKNVSYLIPIIIIV